MKKLAFPLFALAAIVIAAPAHASNADDAKWVSQCLKDNASEKVSLDVMTKYCTCMNDKMSDNETRTITQWEKTHPKEQAECDKESGWK